MGRKRHLVCEEPKEEGLSREKLMWLLREGLKIEAHSVIRDGGMAHGTVQYVQFQTGFLRRMTRGFKLAPHKFRRLC